MGVSTSAVNRATDFGDAIVASLGSVYKGSVILTFDLKFIHTLKKLGLPVEKQ
ncbi:MAG: hypothetical protein QME78_09245 [Thermodesulfobacteriota bacterium]|nr:hypothetical protein [Thermodesulfobacteriota bacterium]